ncbi:MAG: putative small lipoprotein YifL [Gammaproteobacteria bacterium]|jgi:predicted small lipoprotein YifL
MSVGILNVQSAIIRIIALKRRTALRALVGATITVLGASACGQKGPLFRPEDKLKELERKRDKDSDTDQEARKKS